MRDVDLADNVLNASTNFRQRRQERISAAVMVVVLHGAVIAMVMFSRATERAGSAPSLIAFDVPAGGTNVSHLQPAHSEPPRVTRSKPDIPAPLLEIARIDIMQSLPDALPVADAFAQDLPAAIGGGCDLTPQVQDALRHSDEIVRRLPDIPAGRRSIANAIMVWNAGWIAPDAGSAQAALAAIRRTIEQSVAVSSADCRNQRQAGPRLVYLPDNSGKTTVLAIGSGQWTWQQLTTSTAPMPMPAPRLAALLPAASPTRAPTAGTSDQTPHLNALLASLIGRDTSAGKPYYP